MRKIFIIAVCCFLGSILKTEAQERPQMYGFAKMTFLVSSHRMAQEYYGELLGFDKAFEYHSPQGTVVSYKVNDRQFLEFIEDRDAASKSRFVSITIKVSDVTKMREYLVAKNVKASEISTDGAGNKVFTVHDERGITVEFADMNEHSLHAASKGKFLSERRIATRIHHAGLHLNAINKPSHFWTEILGFAELVRIPASHDLIPTMAYYVMPGNTECIECFSNGSSEPGNGFEHACFLTLDMQATLDTLRSRDKSGTKYGATLGRTNRWLLNTTNPDGTKVEFTEPYNIK